MVLFFRVPKEDVALLWIYNIVGFAVFVLVSYLEIKWMSGADIQNETGIKPDFLAFKLAGFFIVLIYSYGVYEHLRAIKLYSESDNEVTVIMEKTKFSTNKQYRYLGKTKNYIFFYDIKKKQAEVYPSSDIKSMLIRGGVIYDNQ